MPSNSIIYSLKIWLTSVLLAPVIYIVAISFKQNHQDFSTLILDQLSIYLICIFFGSFLSFFTWLLFLLSIKATTLYAYSIKQCKFIISFIGVLLTIGTFALFLSPSISIHDDLFSLMLGNCICITGGTWFYELRVTGLQTSMETE